MTLDPKQMIESYGSQVDDYIRGFFEQPHPPAPMYPMAEYHMGWRDQNLSRSKAPQGKMLRTLLALLSYEIFDKDYKKAIPFAAACEIYHNHTLVYDDIQDGDTLRRDRPTVWSLWGIGQGINTGLILGYVAQHFLLELSKNGFSGEKLFPLLRAFADMTFELAEGQSMDLDFESRQNVTPAEYLTMIGKKTGALISLCTFGGAWLGQDDAAIAEKFKTFGRKLGVAMQMRDDLVGIWGGREQSGKEHAKDIRRRKKTFPVLAAFDRFKGDELALLKKHYASQGEPDDADVNGIVAALEREGTRESSMEATRALMAEALAELRGTGIAPEKLAALESFANHAYNAIGTLRQVASKA